MVYTAGMLPKTEQGLAAPPGVRRQRRPAVAEPRRPRRRTGPPRLDRSPRARPARRDRRSRDQPTRRRHDLRSRRAADLLAGRRRLVKDITRRFRVAGTAYETEAALGEDPQPLILGGHGAVIAAFWPNTIARYSTVLVYGEPSVLTRTPRARPRSFVLEPDPLLARYGRTTPFCQAWADLFCLPTWQAARFTHYLIPEAICE